MKGFMVMLLICSVTMSAAALFLYGGNTVFGEALFCESPLLFVACHYYRAYHSLPAEIRQCPCQGECAGQPGSTGYPDRERDIGSCRRPCWKCGSFCSAEYTVVADGGGIVADRNDRISGLSCNQTSPLFEAGVTLER